jgi:hypothetical protein
MVDSGSLGCNFAYAGTDSGYNVQTKVGATVYSELAHPYFVSLGNKSNFDPAGVAQPHGGLTKTGNFQNLQARDYWFGLAYAPDPTYGWRFGTIDGYRDGAFPGYEVYAIAVRPGDVAAVPEPQATVLMLLGLTAIAAVRRQLRA